MTKGQVNFFATVEDLSTMLRFVDSIGELQFAAAGMFASSIVDVRPSLFDFNGIGLAPSGDGNLEPSYLASHRDIAFLSREVVQKDGSIRYAVDQLRNPHSVSLRPGGMYDDRTIISGSVGTIDVSASGKIFTDFKHAIAHEFVKIKSFYVGSGAEMLLNNGGRLTSRNKAPAAYDLSRT